MEKKEIIKKISDYWDISNDDAEYIYEVSTYIGCRNHYVNNGQIYFMSDDEIEDYRGDWMYLTVKKIIDR
jgi:hypothetical protein